MILAQETQVDYEKAKRRALEVLCPNEPKPTAIIAGEIWPNADIKPRTLAAASRVLKRMHREGLARWTCAYDYRGEASEWGWVKTRPDASTRNHAKSNRAGSRSL
jgi:hypothetical protein